VGAVAALITAPPAPFVPEAVRGERAIVSSSGEARRPACQRNAAGLVIRDPSGNSLALAIADEPG